MLASPQAHASPQSGGSRAIAIVFDNSGSMYTGGNQAWCRATYAMEVFAAMLNPGDTLDIYPMHPIQVEGKEYTMNSPFRITDASQSSKIRDIYTPNALGTPIESIDCAMEGIRKATADKKYLIVLSDGNAFSWYNAEMSIGETKRQLDSRFQEAGRDLTMMYLGIGNNVVMPDTPQSVYFSKKQAKNSSDVLSSLTEMCNLIFGRDTLPKSRYSGNQINFDITMSKIIVFVQGENVANLKVTGPSGPVGTQISSAATKYGSAASGSYTSYPDTTLQGMMVTYTDCDPGTYTIEYTGDAVSTEVYYEPNADLDFVFTSASGKTVDARALYEGDYKVSFGLKDGKTGKLIASDLLGNPHYEGSYYINGQEFPISHDGHSGEVPVSLAMGDAFAARLTVTYLSGYTITKDTSDFGWPEDGIRVAARPAGELRLEITGGDSSYPLQDLEGRTPYTAKIYYEGALITGSELERVDLKWQPETSIAEIKKSPEGDHYDLTLHYKDPEAPQNTASGECTVTIYAFYTPQGSSEAMGQCDMTYVITDERLPVEADLKIPQSYITISQLEESIPLKVEMLMGGEPMTAEAFAATELRVDCGGINYEVVRSEDESVFEIHFLPTPGIAEGDYPISVTANYTDRIGRETQAEDAGKLELGTIPMWAKWLIGSLAFLLLSILLWMILRIRVLPKYAHTTKKLSSMIFDGDNVTQATNFAAEIRRGQMKVQSKYAGKNFGVSMDVTPGKESYLYKPQKRRSALVKVASVKKFGPAKIQEVMVGSAKFVVDDSTGKLVPALANQKPFLLTNGMMVKYSGTIQDAGVDKDFEVTSKLNFKKK